MTKTRLKKAAALFLLLSIFSSELSHAAPVGEGRAPVIRPSIETLLKDPSSFEAPSDFSSLKETHRGGSGKLIIHIQDAHSNLSGQKNLAWTLERLIERYGIDLVLVEGGSTADGSFSPLKKTASPEARRRAAESLLAEGRIAGEEYLDLASDHALKLRGVEDMDLYRRSVDAYAALAGKRDDTLAYLAAIGTAVGRLKAKLYPRSLLEYESEKAEGDRVALLWKLVRSAGLDLKEFPAGEKLAALKEKEDSIDFDLANIEQAALIRELGARGQGEALRGHVENFSLSRRSRAAQASLLRGLMRLAEGTGIPPARYPNLQNYAAYLNDFTGMDMDRLLDELQVIEDRVYVRTLGGAKDPDGALLVRSMDRYLGLLEAAHRIQMSSAEYILFEANEQDFATPACLAFVNRKLAELGYFGDLVPYRPVLEEAEPALKDFYASVERRDEAFVRNVQKILAEEGRSAAVLITGGYHTRHLKELLRKKDYSFTVLSPLVTAETDQKKYEELLLSPWRGRPAPTKTVTVGGETSGVRVLRAVQQDRGHGADRIIARIGKSDRRAVRAARRHYFELFVLQDGQLVRKPAAARLSVQNDAAPARYPRVSPRGSLEKFMKVDGMIHRAKPQFSLHNEHLRESRRGQIAPMNPETLKKDIAELEKRPQLAEGLEEKKYQLELYEKAHANLKTALDTVDQVLRQMSPGTRQKLGLEHVTAHQVVEGLAIDGIYTETESLIPEFSPSYRWGMMRNGRTRPMLFVSLKYLAGLRSNRDHSGVEKSSNMIHAAFSLLYSWMWYQTYIGLKKSTADDLERARVVHDGMQAFGAKWRACEREYIGPLFYLWQGYVYLKDCAKVVWLRYKLDDDLRDVNRRAQHISRATDERIYELYGNNVPKLVSISDRTRMQDIRLRDDEINGLHEKLTELVYRAQALGYYDLALDIALKSRNLLWDLNVVDTGVIVMDQYLLLMRLFVRLGRYNDFIGMLRDLKEGEITQRKNQRVELDQWGERSMFHSLALSSNFRGWLSGTLDRQMEILDDEEDRRIVEAVKREALPLLDEIMAEFDKPSAEYLVDGFLNSHKPDEEVRTKASVVECFRTDKIRGRALQRIVRGIVAGKKWELDSVGLGYPSEQKNPVILGRVKELVSILIPDEDEARTLLARLDQQGIVPIRSGAKLAVQLRSARAAADQIAGVGPGMVSADGPSGAGKTTVFREISQILRSRGLKAETLNLDIFMKSREVRIAKQREIVASGKIYRNEWDFFDEERIERVLGQIDEFYRSGRESMDLVIPDAWNSQEGAYRELVIHLTRDTVLLVDGKYSNRFAKYFKFKLRVKNDPATIREQFVHRKRPAELQDIMVRSFDLAFGPSYEAYAEDTEHLIDGVLDLTHPMTRYRQAAARWWTETVVPYFWNRVFWATGVHWVRSYFVLQPFRGEDLTDAPVVFVGAGRLIRGMLAPKVQAAEGQAVFLEMLDDRTSARITEQNGRFQVVEASSDGSSRTLDLRAAAIGSLNDPAVGIAARRFFRNTRRPELVVPFGVTERGITPGSPAILEITGLFEAYWEGHRGKAGFEDPRILVINTDNVSRNGDKIREYVTAEAAKRSSAFAAWIAEHVIFANSVVDRITVAGKNARGETDPTLPQPEAPLPQELALALPAAPALVPGGFIEKFLERLCRMFPNVKLRPSQALLDADEALKLRVALAVHKAMSPAAGVQGSLFTYQAVRIPAFRRFLEGLYEKDLSIVARQLGPQIEAIDAGGSGAEAYVRDLFDHWMKRLENPSIEHNTVWISRNMTMKIGDGFGPTITMLDQLENRQASDNMAFAIAAILRFLTPFGGEVPAPAGEDPIFKGKADTGVDYGPREYYDQRVYTDGNVFTFRDGEGWAPRLLRQLVPAPGTAATAAQVSEVLADFFPRITWRHNGVVHRLSDYPDLTARIEKYYHRMLNGEPVLAILGEINGAKLSSRTRVYLADPWPQAGMDEKIIRSLTAFKDAHFIPGRLDGTEEQFRRLIGDERPTVVILRSRTKFFKEAKHLEFAHANGLRKIIRTGATIDNVDLETARRLGISVVATGGTENSAADIGMRLLLSYLGAQSAPGGETLAADGLEAIVEVPVEEVRGARVLAAAGGRGTVTDERFERLFPALSGSEIRRVAALLEGKTISLVGFGDTAQHFARKLFMLRKMTGVSFTVLATSPSLDAGDASRRKAADDWGVLYPGEAAVLERADILSLHLPADTAGYLDAKKLERMSSVAMVLNTARQAVVASDFWGPFFARGGVYFADVDLLEEAAALAAVRPGQVHVSPHLGGYTATADKDVERALLDRVTEAASEPDAAKLATRKSASGGKVQEDAVQKIERFFASIDELDRSDPGTREPVAMQQQVLDSFDRNFGGASTDQLNNAVTTLNSLYRLDRLKPEWGDDAEESIFVQSQKDVAEMGRILTDLGEVLNPLFLGTDAMFWKRAHSKKFPGRKAAGMFYISQLAMLSDAEYEFVKPHRDTLGESPDKKGLLRGGIAYTVMGEMIRKALEVSEDEGSFHRNLGSMFDDEMRDGPIQKAILRSARPDLPGTDAAVQRDYYELQARLIGERNVFRDTALRVARDFGSLVLASMPGDEPVTVIEVARWGTQPLFVKNAVRHATGSDRVDIRLIVRDRSADGKPGISASRVDKFAFFRERKRLIAGVEGTRPVSFDFVSSRTPGEPRLKAGSVTDKARGALLLLLLETLRPDAAKLAADRYSLQRSSNFESVGSAARLASSSGTAFSEWAGRLKELLRTTHIKDRAYEGLFISIAESGAFSAIPTMPSDLTRDYLGSGMATPSDITAKSVLMLLAIHLLDQSSAKDHFEAEDLNILQEAVSLYNARPEVHIPLSLPYLFNLSLSPYFIDHAGYRRLSGQLIHLPEPLAVPAVAMSLFLGSIHRRGAAKDRAEDFGIIVDELEWLFGKIGGLSGKNRSAALTAVASTASFFIPFLLKEPEYLNGEPKPLSQVKGLDDRTISRLGTLFLAHSAIVDEAIGLYPVRQDAPKEAFGLVRDLRSEDPYLLGMTWLLYSVAEKQLFDPSRLRNVGRSPAAPDVLFLDREDVAASKYLKDVLNEFTRHTLRLNPKDRVLHILDFIYSPKDSYLRGRLLAATWEKFKKGDGARLAVGQTGPAPAAGLRILEANEAVAFPAPARPTGQELDAVMDLLVLSAKNRGYFTFGLTETRYAGVEFLDGEDGASILRVLEPAGSAAARRVIFEWTVTPEMMRQARERFDAQNERPVALVSETDRQMDALTRDEKAADGITRILLGRIAADLKDEKHVLVSVSVADAADAVLTEDIAARVREMRAELEAVGNETARIHVYFEFTDRHGRRIELEGLRADEVPADAVGGLEKIFAGVLDDLLVRAAWEAGAGLLGTDEERSGASYQVIPRKSELRTAIMTAVAAPEDERVRQALKTLTRADIGVAEVRMVKTVPRGSTAASYRQKSLYVKALAMVSREIYSQWLSIRYSGLSA